LETLTFAYQGGYDDFVKIELILPAVEENARSPVSRCPSCKSSPTDGRLLSPMTLGSDRSRKDLKKSTWSASRFIQNSLAGLSHRGCYRKKEYPSFSAEFIRPPSGGGQRHADRSSLERLKKSGLIHRRCQNGNLKPFLPAGRLHRFSKDPCAPARHLPQKDTFPWMSYRSHGDSLRCEFAPFRIFWRAYRFRPVSDVVDEVRRLPHRLTMFTMTYHRKSFYSKELSRRSPPEEKWFSRPL